MPLPVRVRDGGGGDCDCAAFGVVDDFSSVVVLVNSLLEVFVLSSSSNKLLELTLLSLLLCFTGMLRFLLIPRPLGVPLFPKDFLKLIRGGDNGVFDVGFLVVIGGVELLPLEFFVIELTSLEVFVLLLSPSSFDKLSELALALWLLLLPGLIFVGMLRFLVTTRPFVVLRVLLLKLL